ncbi:MAG: PepSY domain-containing protein [Kiloniellales bacterium]
MTVQVRYGGLLSGALLVTQLVFSNSAAAISQDEAAQQIAERFAVEVLDVKAGQIDGQAVWLITVMKPGGNRNDAFQVTRLALDRESGELLPAFRHGTSGYELPERSVQGERIDLRPDALRSGTWR